MRNVTLSKWQYLNQSSVEIRGLIVRPVILAEFHIKGRRKLHCMFQDPADGEWKPVAFVPEATLSMVDAEYVAALVAMDFKVAQDEWN
jgi:hypothetical protein